MDLIGTRLGPYEIVALLGAGGMGEVYRAQDTRLGREVAIKVLPDTVVEDVDRLRRFEQEARAVATLNHPNILVIHDIGSQAGRPYIVSELLDGGTLRERLAGGSLPPPLVLDFTTQIARGLSAAHDRGIVHRDLKPENLLVTEEGVVKLLDFGLAKLKRSDAAQGNPSQATTAAMTQPGTVLGTAAYMSPEQVRGQETDHRSDLFALGAIVHEMLTGNCVFTGETAVEVMSAVLRDDPPQPLFADVPLASALARIARRCLAKEPEQRFQHARDVGFALETASTATRSAAKRGRSVAVPPFTDLAGDEKNAHLGLGLSDAIITELAGMKSLLVRPTSTILRYQEHPVPPEQAGRELGVDAVVAGSFQRAGPRIRVTVQLIATGDARPLWGTKVDTTIDDVFQMQDDVSRKVCKALVGELSPSDEQRAVRGAQPAATAYERYLKGRFHLYREDLADVNAAVECFEEARDADPGFALAWIGLADAYLRLVYTFQPEGGWGGRAREACNRALALDPDLPEGRYIRGRLIWTPEGGFDHAGALREMAAALSRRPNLAEAWHWMGTICLHVDLVDEAIRAFERARKIDPDEQISLSLLGYCRYLQGNFDNALAITEESLRIVPSAWACYQQSICQLQLGRLEETERTVDRASRRFPESVLYHSVRGLVAARRGQREAAVKQIELTERYRKSFGHYHHAQNDVACIYALLGDAERATEWLERASRNGFPSYGSFRIDPLLSSLQGMPRFEQLMLELQRECAGYRQLYHEELRLDELGPD